MKYILSFLFAILFCTSGFTQIRLEDVYHEESAKSYIDQKCPKFDIKEWVSKKPNVKGKFVLIDFWAIWAYPCTHYTVPYLNDLAKKFKKDLVIIGLSQEIPFYIKQMDEPKIKYYNATVDSLVIDKTFRITGFPFSYLIAPDGTVVWEGLTMKKVDEVQDKLIPRLTEANLRKIIADYKKKNKKRK